MAEKQLILVVEGTAAMGHFWHTILSDYLEKIVRGFSGTESSGQKTAGENVDLALVIYNTHGPYSHCLVQRSGWTKDVDSYMQWLNSIPFFGGGFNEAAISEGLAEALVMFSGTSNTNQSQPNVDTRKHCILLAASNPHHLPTPVYKPVLRSSESKESPVTHLEASLSDAETVAKWFPECSISFSVISPKQLPKLRSIYNAGKQNPRVSDPSIDSTKNPQFLVLISENFMEAKSSLSRSGMNNLQSNQGSPAPPISNSTLTSLPPANVPSLTRQTVPTGIAPAAVKMEPNTIPSVNGPSFSHGPAIPVTASQGMSTLVNSSSPASQEINSGASDTVQEFKPLVNSQSQRALGPAPANVNILNTLSQVRLNSATIAGGNPISLQNVGPNPMAMHMSNMISNGMASSAINGSSPLMGNAQVSNNAGLGPYVSATSGLSGNSLAGLQGPLGMTQPMSVVGQGSLTSGSQMSQSGVNMGQNMINGLGPNVSSGSGTMMPTPGMMSQQVQSVMHPLGAGNSSSGSMPMAQNVAGGQQQPSKYVKIWEGDLSGQRQGQPMLICKLEGYRNMSASERLAEDWPPTMQIVRLISQDHMNNKQYIGKADFLVFRTLNQHGFLGQLQERKLCAVIQLPSQTLLLSITDKASRLIGMLFPGDMVVFKPQIPNQPQHHHQQQQQQQQLQQQQQQIQQQQQQLQQQQQQLQQQQLQQQQQQLQQQQLQQQQMVGPTMGSYVQAPGRAQMMAQGKMPSQSMGGMQGAGFLP